MTHVYDLQLLKLTIEDDDIRRTTTHLNGCVYEIYLYAFFGFFIYINRINKKYKRKLTKFGF